MTQERQPGFDTLAIHAGAQPDPATGARITPIYQTTAYVFDDVDHAAALFNLETFGNIYSRIMNPTQAVLESRVAALEGGTAALAAASGHGAQLLIFHTLLEPGDEFISAGQLYGGSINQFNHAFKKFNWNVVWANADDPSSFERAVSPKTKAIFIESIANPGGIVVDIPAIAAIAKKAGVPLIVDNTLATPYLCRPKEMGADIIVHSMTKFLGGHGNSIGGMVVDCGTLRLDRLRTLSVAVGAFALLSRHDHGRDIRQFRLRHCRPRIGLARSRPFDRADERLPHSHRHRNPAAAHGTPLPEHACGRRVAANPSRGRMGAICRAA